ncbi:MAG: hypothetical protein K2P19_10275 [Kineothrix sp.]|nr:hypothetical protein [Kineothrix sp.]
MDREIIFARTLEEVKKKAKEQGNCISQEQLEEAFAKLELGKDQLALVADYLEKHKIGIDEPVNAQDYLTGEEIHYLDTYLEELKALMEQNGLMEMTEGEREAITISAMAGDKQAQARLTEIYLPEVVEIAKLYGGQGVYLEDLIGEGNVAVAAGVTMLGCLEHPEEARGMLGKMIMDAMEEHISDSLEEAGSNKKIADKVNRVAEQAKELAQLLQRKVTVEELALET